MLAGELTKPTSLREGPERIDAKDRALVALGRYLKCRNYRFASVTPLTQSRVRNRNREAETLGDIFGWNRSFRPQSQFADVIELLTRADEITFENGRYRSNVRFSSLGAQLFVHSSFPTLAEDSVFFGPDSHRFCRAIDQYMPKAPAIAIDIGCGSGVGGLHVASLRKDDPRIVLIDVNRKALRFARINAMINHVANADFVNSDVLTGYSGDRPDLIVSNPPYLVDRQARTYRHGGRNGYELSLRILRESLRALAPDGRLILYSGTAVRNGVDPFRQQAEQFLRATEHPFAYEEIDPDVFGEELEKSPYDDADRIAAVALVVDARSKNNKRTA